jgi:branched-chain amino acid transport system substrate-binding protein
MKFIAQVAVMSSFLATSAFAAPVKVGVALRFTPDLNSFAGSLYEGIELAAETFNAKNGPVAIELVKYPHKSGHDTVEQAAEKVVKDKVNYVLGGEMSDEAFALAEQFKGHKVLFMTPTASNPLLTAGNPLTFRACFSDDVVAEQFAKYVASVKTVKSIGVLHNTSNAYSDYVTNAFLDAFEKIKNKSVQIQEFRYASEKPQFEGAVEQFKKAKVDTVIAFTLQESLKAFQTAAIKNGLNPLYIGSDGWGTMESLVKNFSGFKGVRNDYWNPESKTSAVTQFKLQIQKKFSHAADAWNAEGYDTALVLFQAIAKAKDPNDVNEVANILHSDSFSGTVTASSIRFGRNNSTKKPMYLYEINQGAVKFLKAVE